MLLLGNELGDVLGQYLKIDEIIQLLKKSKRKLCYYLHELNSQLIGEQGKRMWPDRNSNPGSPAYRASTLTTELLSHMVSPLHGQQVLVTPTRVAD